MQMQAKELQSEIDVMQNLMIMQATQARQESDESDDEVVTQKDIKEYTNLLKVSVSFDSADVACVGGVH